MRRFRFLVLLMAGLTLALTRCTPADMWRTTSQGAPLRTPTSLPATAATPPVLSSPGLMPPLTPADTKPGPPPGYVEPTPAPTPTVATALPPSEWQEILLPPPEGSAQIVPAGVPVPTVSIAIPKQWVFGNHPGSYLVGPPGPSPLPMVVLGPSLPFAVGEEPIPQNLNEFTEALARIYPKRYGVSAQAERIAVGGHEGVLLFPSQGEVCAELFVPLGGRYDVAYQFTFVSSLCETPGRLTETGQTILRSIQFK